MPIQDILNYDEFMDDGKLLVMDLLEHRPKQEICLRLKWPIMTHDRSLKRLTSPTKNNSVFLMMKIRFQHVNVRLNVLTFNVNRQEFHMSDMA